MERHIMPWKAFFSVFFFPGIFCHSLALSQPELNRQTKNKCNYLEECYTWTSLPSGNALNCDMDGVPQTNPTAVLDPCPGWFRTYVLYPYGFQILPSEIDAVPEEKRYSQFARSKCYVKAAPNSVYPNIKSAAMRSAVLRPNGCVKLQTTFWYRMSAAPILTGDRNKDYFLELVVHHSADNAPGFIPNWQIWGSSSDYAAFPGPNEWTRVQTEYADDQFTLNFYAHHGDTCNTTSIDIDSIDTKIAVPSTSCTVMPSVSTIQEVSATALPDITTLAAAAFTTVTQPATAQHCEFAPAVVARCLNGKVTMPAVEPELSDASEAVYAGDNTYLCRTHLHSLHAWLLEQAAKTVPHPPPNSFTTVNCQRGALQFSASDPDTALSTGLQFRAASVDAKCRNIFAGFLTQLALLRMGM
ncbi:uncharacterized protein LOC129581616 [Paramacrobiotus metropolitanus]|uniref:uncharacterized protein LOC129581616 n=1 Tax=Paramacrobiotus metropolitanus TaxID=2943436 RepID=UPI0024456A29|nr:uncharacterized protein LOC129581616 [Paramacrobiotus metropolitanus]